MRHNLSCIIPNHTCTDKVLAYDMLIRNGNIESHKRINANEDYVPHMKYFEKIFKREAKEVHLYPILASQK